MPAITVDNLLVLPTSHAPTRARPSRATSSRHASSRERETSPDSRELVGVAQAARRGASAALQATTWSSIVVT